MNAKKSNNLVSPNHSQHPKPADLRTATIDLLYTPLTWLLIAMPLALVLDWFKMSEMWVFVVSAFAIIPLAGLMGRATENLAVTLGAGIGGLLNATFGNAAELIIAVIALSKGPDMYPLVKASITGSIIGNILLVLGLSIFLGGLKYERQTFNRTAAGMGATLLALASIGLIVPTLYYYLCQTSAGVSDAEAANIGHLSEEIAGILAVIYLLSLLFSLKTHRHLFSGPEEDQEGEHHEPEWSRGTALSVLLASTAGIAWMSELLVGSVEHAGPAMNMNQVFVGVIVVAVIGNAAEHSTAILMALKNKMDLAVHIAVGSGIQIALFVAPVLVFISMTMNATPLDLHFTALEVISVVLAVGVLSMVSSDGESHWMEGVMLLGVYIILALAFYYLPVGTETLHTP